MKYYTRSAIKFLDLNWKEKIFKNPDLQHDQLAEMLGFDRYMPSLKMCKRNFNLTIAKFYIHCRVAEIKQFLAQPESKEYELIEIAHKLGYPHRRNFNRNFRAVEGITQREFWYFIDHFEETTGTKLVNYQQPKLKRYMPANNKPSFLSNFLNSQMEMVLYHERND